MDAIADSGDTARLEHATTTTPETYAVAHSLLICFGLVLLCFFLLELPWTAFRLSHFGPTTGWTLSSSPPKRLSKHYASAEKNTDVKALTQRAASGSALPRRLARLPFALPTYAVPLIGLSLAQTLLLLIAFVILTIASFLNSNLITDSTRTGYVGMSLVPLVISLGNKVRGLRCLPPS